MRIALAEQYVQLELFLWNVSAFGFQGILLR